MLDRVRRGWTLVAWIWLAAAAAAAAQVGSGSLVGDVVDEAGAAVAGATVTTTATGTGVSRTTSTNADGRYVVAGLAPGGYAVRVELPGFAPAVRDGIVLQTGQTLRVDLPLRVGGRTEAVTVSAAPPLLRSETVGPRPRDRPAARRRSAAQRPQLHRAGQPGAGRRATAAARGPVAADQRRTAAHQRIPLRRHLGAPARAGPGRVLPERRRHPGVHDREQQPAGRVRPLQRRCRQPDDEVRPERSARQPVRVRPPRGRSTRATSSRRVPRPSRGSGATSSAVWPAARSGRAPRSSLPTIRASARRSAGRRSRRCRPRSSARASSPRRSPGACR